MKHQKRLTYGLWIFRVLYCGGIFCMLSSLFLRSMTPVYVGVAVVVIAAILGDLMLRCPACGKSLEVRIIPSVPRFCPNCGEQLRKE